MFSVSFKTQRVALLLKGAIIKLALNEWATMLEYDVFDNCLEQNPKSVISLSLDPQLFLCG